MNGFFGKILQVNVTDQSYEEETIPEAVMRDYLGGKGLATWLLLRDNPAGVDPLSPDNRLIFASGPLTGSAVWGSCRHGIYTKSPQTGFFSESYSGGKLADRLAATGYDAVVVYGAAKHPVILEIGENTVAFHPADNLWGKETYETEDQVSALIAGLRPEAKHVSVACIGPAAEQLVRFAVVENDYWRSAGRTGTGAVMGAKKIKAMAFWGNLKKEFFDPGAVFGFSKETATRGKTDAGANAYRTKGTPMLVDIMHGVSGFPARYWQQGSVAYQNQINADALHSRCDVVPHPCLKCFMACGRLSTVKSGRHQGLKIEGPEYETIYAFGGLCGVQDIEEIAYLNDLCDRLGMDTISTGNLVGLTIEASRQGKIDLAIDYGQVDAMAEVIRSIAARQGIGAVLAEGIRSAAVAMNMADQAVHVKGLEPAGYDPRALKGMGLAYGSSPRGACHLRATFYKPELAGIVDSETIGGKAAVFTEWEDRLIVFDTLVLCRFYRDLYQWEQLSTMVAATTGLKLDREGLTSADDQLPKRLYKEVLPETGKGITQAQMTQMLSEYYQARGWNAAGVPPEVVF